MDEMTVTISVDKEWCQQILGKGITQEQFEQYCKDAIASKMFMGQFVPDMQGDSDKLDL
jgi:hypothetical protein